MLYMNSLQKAYFKLKLFQLIEQFVCLTITFNIGRNCEKEQYFAN